MATRWTQADIDAIQARARSLRMVYRPENKPSPATTSPTRPKSKRPKFLNEQTTGIDGVVHDAKGEWQRYEDLKLMERAGEIRNLRRQVVYALVVNGLLITTYKADFVYEEGAATVVEDRKSPRTRKLESFRHKVKLMQACHGIQVREV